MGIYLQNGLDDISQTLTLLTPRITREGAIKAYFLADKQKPLLVNELPMWPTDSGNDW